MNHGFSFSAKRGCVRRFWISPAPASCVRRWPHGAAPHTGSGPSQSIGGIASGLRRAGAGEIRRRVAELRTSARPEENPQVFPPLVLAHERPAWAEQRVAGIRKPPQGAPRSRPLSRSPPCPLPSPTCRRWPGRWGHESRWLRRTGKVQRRRSRRASRFCSAFEIPTTAWRVHATRSDLYRQAKNEAAAEAHRARAEAIILALANSFAPDDPLRHAFLAAAPVRRILRVEWREQRRAATSGSKVSRSPARDGEGLREAGAIKAAAEATT